MATPQFINWIEGQAYGLRKISGVSTFGRLDPFELAKKMSVEVIDPTKIKQLAREILDHLTGDSGDSQSWSAGTLPLPGGKMIVVINPTHKETRQRASLMEELVHIKLNHKPTKLVHADGMAVRNWDQTQETQAYWVGAAALLPRCVMKGAKTLGWTAEKIAKDHGVSLQLVEFREKVLGIKLKREPPPIAESGSLPMDWFPE